MITKDQLDVVKLVTELQISDAVLLDAVENAVTQYSGWGTSHKDDIILGLSTQLYVALKGATANEETFNNLKGLQLENGRLKKRLSNAEEAAFNLQARIEDLESELEEIDNDESLDND